MTYREDVVVDRVTAPLKQLELEKQSHRCSLVGEISRLRSFSKILVGLSVRDVLLQNHFLLGVYATTRVFQYCGLKMSCKRYKSMYLRTVTRCYRVS